MNTPSPTSAPPSGWVIRDIVRAPAFFFTKLELVSFTRQYREEPPERLNAIPLPLGVSPEELVRWCARTELPA